MKGEVIGVGARVCVKGRGTSAFIHEHTVVARITKTMIVTSNGRRFRRDDHGSIPYSPYSGARISLTCQNRRRS